MHEPVDNPTGEGHEDEDDDFFLDDVPEDDQFGRLKYLSKCQELRVNPVSQILKYLEGEELLVAHYGLGLKGTICLAEALKINTNLTTVRLADNNIPDAALVVFFKELSDKKQLTSVDISGNKLSAAGCRALTDALTTKGNGLRSIAVSRMHLGDREGVMLAQCLENNTLLRSLDLSHNDFAERTGAALGAMLQVNIALVDLGLSWNKFRARGSAAIADGLRPNLMLQTLDIAWCGMQDGGATAMGAVLKTNQGLVDLDLSGNGITAEGSKCLAAGVALNTSLAAITLDNNDLRDEGAAALLASLEKNTGLVSCHIENCNTGASVRSAIETLLAPRVRAAPAQGLELGQGGFVSSHPSRTVSRNASRALSRKGSGTRHLSIAEVEASM